MRRDRDPRPPVEVIGAAADEGPLQTVEVGGGRRTNGRGRAAVALLAMVIVGGLVVGSDGSGSSDGPRRLDDAERAGASGPSGQAEEERDNSHKLPLKNPTSTAGPTSTTAPPGPSPVLPGSTASVVLIGRGPVEVLELATGITTELDFERDAYGVIQVDGAVVAVESGRARLHPLRSGGPVVLGSADQVLTGGDGQLVWLVSNDVSYEGTQATLVDLAGRVEAGPFAVGGWVIGAAGDGLLFQAGGRIYELARDGDVRAITSGEPLGVTEGRLVARTCDDEALCAIEIWDADLRGSRTVDDVGVRHGASVALQPGGRLAAIRLFTEQGPQIAVIDLDGGATRFLEEASFVSSVAWLPGDEGLLLARSSELLRVYERGDELVAEELLDRGADQVVVIDR